MTNRKKCEDVLKRISGQLNKEIFLGYSYGMVYAYTKYDFGQHHAPFENYVKMRTPKEMLSFLLGVEAGIQIMKFGGVV